MRLTKSSLFLTLLVSVSAWSLEPYQGKDYAVETWRCGAPLVEALRKDDPEKLLNDPSGQLKLKESLEAISTSNLDRLKKKLLPLSKKEKDLLDLISDKFPPPIVHRTSVQTAEIVVAKKQGMVSAAKRGDRARGTPSIENQMFSGYDCIFTTVAPPYGLVDYGTVIVRFENNKGFAWGSLYTGYRWAIEVEGKNTNEAPNWMKRRFAKQIFTDNHWDQALGLLIIENVRAGTSFRNTGARYDKTKILDELLSSASSTEFWKTIINHRLAFLEAHYTDNISLDDINFVQFRTSDRSSVESWNLPTAWFQGNDSFIQFFNRPK